MTLQQPFGENIESDKYGFLGKIDGLFIAGTSPKFTGGKSIGIPHMIQDHNPGKKTHEAYDEMMKNIILAAKDRS